MKKTPMSSRTELDGRFAELQSALEERRRLLAAGDQAGANRLTARTCKLVSRIEPRKAIGRKARRAKRQRHKALEQAISSPGRAPRCRQPGRERRPATNARRHGSQRNNTRGSPSSDDPHLDESDTAAAPTGRRR
jgi:hypothetical protein